MDFPFETVEIYLSDKSPDRLKQKTVGKIRFSAHFSGFRQPLDFERNPI
jgi:hypothetical protein